MTTWVKTSSRGVRYREHPTRKHGIMPDRYYSIYFKIDKRQIEEGLGWAHEGMTQEKAENIRRELKQSAKKGGPKTLKEVRAIADAALNIDDLLKEIWDIELQHKKSGIQTKRLLEKDVLPVWGKRKVIDIKRRDIVQLLDRIKERAPVTANRVHGALTRLFNFAAERGVIEDSPCTRIRKTPESGRQRVLSDDEIKSFWAALDLENIDIDLYRTSKLALKMILLTGQRPGEVCGMTWNEIDGNTWNIPADRMKNKEAHSVPLCPMALEVIEQAKSISEDSPFVFKSSHISDGPITTRSLSKGVLRHRKEFGADERFTPHDLRRTLRTRLAELGVDEIIAERVLGHKLQGVSAVYNRHEYSQEKRQALSRWEGRLRRIVGLEQSPAGKVISLRR